MFVWANDGEQLKVDVPIVFKGLDDCPGLKKGKYTLVFCSYLLPSFIKFHILLVGWYCCVLVLIGNVKICSVIWTNDNFAD